MAAARVRALLVALAGLGALFGVACLDRPAGRPDRGDAPGAEVVSFRTEDGVTLSGRLWARDPRRLVIYLHEYRGTQATWWPTARAGEAAEPSAMTFDFRGHGTSEGDEDDLAGIVPDAAAALAFARERGYERVVFVGAGMGAAAAIVVAAPAEHVAVLGLSAPSEFADVRADEAVAPIAG
ncbi:MAG: alpha/beta hydrolase, partial [Dehalococcoidia bacterium]